MLLKMIIGKWILVKAVNYIHMSTAAINDIPLVNVS